MKPFRLLNAIAIAVLLMGIVPVQAAPLPQESLTPDVADAPITSTAWPIPAGPQEPAGQIESLSGSYVAFDPLVGAACYIPGAAQTFCFRAESFTNDYEYVYNVWQRFPADWTVSNVYVLGTPACDSGTWGAFSWLFETSPYEVNINHPRYQQATDHCTAYYCFDVTSGTGTPDALESWYWDGDGYGAAPHHPCSVDQYTPASMAAQPCDEAINPLASIPPCAQPYVWLKEIDGIAWTPGISITRQTSDTIVVHEIIDPLGPVGFTLAETWDPGRLQMTEPALVLPPDYQAFVTWDPAAGLWTLAVPAGVYFGPVEIFKPFHVEPCTWTETLLWEELFIGGALVETRPVLINKLPPQLGIDAVYTPPVVAGTLADFTLVYSNSGGFENDVWIRNEFPPEALLAFSYPPPTNMDPNGLWAEWYIAGLPQGAMGNIDVTVIVAPNLPPSTTITIWDGIFDHVGVMWDEVFIGLHVVSPIGWDKTIDGLPWTPGISITRQTSDTIMVQEVLHVAPPLLKAAVTPVLVQSDPPPDLRADLTAQAGGPRAPVAPRSPEAILWDQSTAQSSAGVSDYMTNVSVGVFSADDFQNPVPWAIDTIFVDGFDQAANLLRASLLTWYIYPEPAACRLATPAMGRGLSCGACLCCRTIRPSPSG